MSMQAHWEKKAEAVILQHQDHRYRPIIRFSLSLSDRRPTFYVQRRRQCSRQSPHIHQIDWLRMQCTEASQEPGPVAYGVETVKDVAFWMEITMLEPMTIYSTLLSNTTPHQLLLQLHFQVDAILCPLHHAWMQSFCKYHFYHLYQLHPL